jgi:TIR domain
VSTRAASPIARMRSVTQFIELDTFVCFVCGPVSDWDCPGPTKDVGFGGVRIEGFPMAEVFLSYSAHDRDAAQSIARAIERSGLSVFDSTQMKSGASWQDEVRTGTEATRCVLVLWSEAAAQSLWVEQEIRLAIRAWSEGRLLLARLDDAELPAGLRDLTAEELSYGLDDVDLEALVERARKIAATSSLPELGRQVSPGVRSSTGF